MFKFILASLFALVVGITSLEAGTSTKVFKGTYTGAVILLNASGDSIAYSPIKVKISRTGVITGTAYNSKTQKVLKVAGMVRKVTLEGGFKYLGKVSGTFSDGTKWSGVASRLINLPTKAIVGKAKNGSFSGNIGLHDL